MLLSEISAAIDYLIHQWHPNLKNAQATLPLQPGYTAAQSIIARAEVDKTRLMNIPNSELEKMVAEERAKEALEVQLKSEEGLKKLEHNLPSSKLDSELWGRMSSLDSLEEGSLLSEDIDPYKVPWNYIQQFTTNCPKAEKVRTKRILISRAINDGDIPEKAKPLDFIERVKQLGIDFSADPIFVQRIRELNANLVSSMLDNETIDFSKNPGLKLIKNPVLRRKKIDEKLSTIIEEAKKDPKFVLSRKAFAERVMNFGVSNKW